MPDGAGIRVGKANELSVVSGQLLVVSCQWLVGERGSTGHFVPVGRQLQAALVAKIFSKLRAVLAAERWRGRCLFHEKRRPRPARSAPFPAFFRSGKDA